jgi:hypothetical protein
MNQVPGEGRAIRQGVSKSAPRRFAPNSCACGVAGVAPDCAALVQATLLTAVVQPHSAALGAGPCQPDTVRAKLACQSIEASQPMNSAMGYGFQGQGHLSS